MRKKRLQEAFAEWDRVLKAKPFNRVACNEAYIRVMKLKIDNDISRQSWRLRQRIRKLRTPVGHDQPDWV